MNTNDWGGKDYWNGGYNTKRHGSAVMCSPIDGTQVETPFELRRDPSKRRHFAHVLANSIIEFFNIHYKISLSSTSQNH